MKPDEQLIVTARSSAFQFSRGLAMNWKRLQPFMRMALLLLIAIGISGCAMLGEGTLLEGTLGRGVLRRAAGSEIAVLERSGLRFIGGDIVVSDAAMFRNAMEGVRIERMAFGRPQLRLASEARPFAEVISSRSIKLLRTGERLELPGELRVINSSKVNVRVGPGREYRAFRQVDRDRLVLVEVIDGDWCRVQLDNEVGWVAAALLAAVVSDDQEH